MDFNQIVGTAAFGIIVVVMLILIWPGRKEER